MLAEITELCELISPKLFGKPYSELGFMESLKDADKGDRYRCAQEAAKIRYEALARMQKATGRGYGDASWPELLQFCEQIISERGLLREPGEEE